MQFKIYAILGLPAFLVGVPAEKAGGLSAASPRHAQKHACGLSASIPNAEKFNNEKLTIFY